MVKQSGSSEAHFIAAENAAGILRANGYDAYLIGGAVRDLLLGSIPKDFDLVTNARPEQIEAIPEFARSKHKDTSQAFGVTRTIISIEHEGETIESHIEIATYRRDLEAHLGRKLTKVEFADLTDDVLRRDFTINALAFDLDVDVLIDLVDGLRDLEHKQVRFIGDPLQRIQEDPLRVLRGLRFTYQLGFEFEFNTGKAIKEAIAGGVVSAIATDRVRDELTQMLTLPERGLALRGLDEFGVLSEVLPEVAAGKAVLQPNTFHGDADVFEHTVTALTYLPEGSSRRLVWATLLHDIGKPVTAESAETTGDRIRFSSHAPIGAELATKRLRALNFSKKATADIAWLIHYHMTVDQLTTMNSAHQHHYMSHPAFPDLLELHKADARAAWSQAHNGTDGSKQDLGFSELEDIYEKYQLELAKGPKPTLKSSLGIDGQWIMQRYDIEPGERLGKLLDTLNRAFVNGEITSETQAQELISKHLKS